MSITFVAAMSAKLSDLPPAIRSTISSAITALPPSPQLLPILSHCDRPHQRLPSGLLPIAQSSSTYATAIADALGPRSSYLSRHVSKRDLHKWISALAPSVKAVSFWDSEIISYGISKDSAYTPHLTSEAVTQDVLQAFQAMADERVKLCTLDVSNVPFEQLNDKTQLQDGLINVLEKSRQSLRQLSVRVHEACKSSLAVVKLDGLDVLELRAGGIEYFKGMSNGEWTGIDFWDLVKAVGVELRDLRLKEVMQPPVSSVEGSEIGPQFFAGVKALTLEHSSWVQAAECGRILQFVTLFGELEEFHWNGGLSVNEVRMVLKACPSLVELHWRPTKRYAVNPRTNSDEDVTTIPEVLEMTQGTLRTLILNAFLSEAIVKGLHSSTNLEVFGADITADNVAHLSALFGQNRKIRVLNLRFPDIGDCTGGYMESLNQEGWQRFVEGISCAPVELEEVRILNESEYEPAEQAVEPLVNAIVETLRALGERAKVVRFEVPASIIEYRIMFDALIRVLEAGQRCRNIEELQIRLGTADADFYWNSTEERKVKCAALLDAIDKLKKKAPRLHLLFLDDFDKTAAEPPEEEEDDDENEE